MMTHKLLLAVLLALVMVVGITTAATITIESATVSVDSITTVDAVLDSAPNGLAGYSITFTVADGGVATIQSVSFPAWAVINTESATPGASVDLTAADLNTLVQAGATDVTLATFTLYGVSNGATTLNASITSIDNDLGNPINPSVAAAPVTVSPVAGATWPLCAGVTTGVASDIGSNIVTLNGVGVGAGDSWFVLGSTSNGYSWATEPVVGGGAYSTIMEGLPLSSGGTYYYRACSECGYGAEVSFTLGAVTPIPTTTYEEQYYAPFVETKWNMAALAEVVPTAYTDKWGMFIWALFWGGLMLAFWIRQEDVTIPAFLYIIVFIALQLSNWIPVEMIGISYLMLLVSFGGIFVSWFVGRKNI